MGIYKFTFSVGFSSLYRDLFQQHPSGVVPKAYLFSTDQPKGI